MEPINISVKKATPWVTWRHGARGVEFKQWRSTTGSIIQLRS